MTRRWMLATLLASLLCLTFALPALGGGSATVQLDEPLTDLTPGEPTNIGFTLLQHGQTPTDWTTTYFSATNTTTGETVRFDAVTAGEVGHWTVEVNLPSAGTWNWQIQTDELFVVTEFEPITVTGATGLLSAANSVTPAQLQTAVDDAVAGATRQYDKQLSSMSGQIDVLEKQVTSLSGERDTLQKQIGNLETAVAQAETNAASAASTSNESGITWWIAALAGAAGAIAVGLAAYAVVRWRGVSFDHDVSTPVPAR